MLNALGTQLAGRRRGQHAPACLSQDPAWRSGLLHRWQNLRAGPWSEASIRAALAGTQAELQEPADRTVQKWGPALNWGDLRLADVMEQITSWLLSRLVYVPVPCCCAWHAHLPCMVTVTHVASPTWNHCMTERRSCQQNG